MKVLLQITRIILMEKRRIKMENNAKFTDIYLYYVDGLY